MLANRTGRRSILTPVHITAVTALPLRLLLALEYRSVDNPFVKTAVTFFMFDLHFSYHAESSRNLRKALFVGHLREIGIEFPPLFQLAFGRCKQIFGRRAYHARRIGGGNLHHAPFEKTEKLLGMFLLLFRGLGEYRGYLFEALLFGDARKESIARPGLRFPCKSLQQVLFCLGTFD